MDAKGTDVLAYSLKWR